MSTSYEDMYSGPTESERRVEEMKQRVGNAPYGTTQYWKNAANVLSVNAGSGEMMDSRTRAKLSALADSDDQVTRRIARDALDKENKYWDDYFDELERNA